RRDEAKLLAFWLARDVEAQFLGKESRFLLGLLAKGEHRTSEALLAHNVEHIGLVFAHVDGLAESKTAVGSVCAPRVMARRNEVSTERLCLREKCVKFDEVVAANAGSGCSTAAVLLNAIVDDVLV